MHFEPGSAALNLSAHSHRHKHPCPPSPCRLSALAASSYTFYANELGLHEGDGSPGSAHACPGMETVVVLRNPFDHVRSHIVEVDRVYKM